MERESMHRPDQNAPRPQSRGSSRLADLRRSADQYNQVARDEISCGLANLNYGERLRNLMNPPGQ